MGKSESKNCGEHSIGRQLAALAVPTFGQLVAEPVFILIDTAIVGHLGREALAALSLGSTVVLTAVGLCVFLAYATTSRVARLFGAGRRAQGLQVGVDSLWLSLLIGVVLAAFLLAAAGPLCVALAGPSATDAVIDQAVAYTRAVACGVPGMLLVFAANGIFRGLQKVKITLVAAVTGALLNTVLDVVFVMGLGWGVAGSGAATLAAQWYMGLFLAVPAVVFARRGGASLRPRLARVAAAGGDGLPLFFRTLALRGALVLTVAAAGQLGVAVLAGYQVVNAIWNFAVNVLDSVAIAGQTLVGAQLGAGNVQRARELTAVCGRAGLAMGALLGVVFIATGFAFAPVFSPDPQVQAVAVAGMIVTGAALPLQGWAWALDGILMGAGDFRFLAVTVAVSAVVYAMLLGAMLGVVCPLLPLGAPRAAALWIAFDFGLMGFRALANGLRVRTDAWMRFALRGIAPDQGEEQGE